MQLSLFITTGAPGPAITLTKSCGRCPRRCVSRVLWPKRRVTPANFRGYPLARTPSRERSAETYNYRENSPRYFARFTVEPHRLQGFLPQGAKGKGRFSFSVCYLPRSLLRITHCTLCASEHVNLWRRTTDKDFP